MSARPPSSFRPPRPPRPWYRRKRVLIPAGILFALWLIGTIGGDPEPQRTVVDLAQSDQTTTTTRAPTTAAPATTSAPTTTVAPSTTAKPKRTSPPTTKHRRTTTTRAPAPDCHPSYEGACLRIDASDYDCAGGGGNGPYYVRGPVTVVGDDEYGLDADDDGIGCERD